MTLWKFWCIYCEKNVAELQNNGRQGEQEVGRAICRECSKKIVWGLPMADLLCENCLINGKPDVKAMRTYGSWGLCENCYVASGRPPIGSPRPKRQPEMPPAKGSAAENAVEVKGPGGKRVLRRLNIDWVQAQADRDGGMNTMELAIKYGCSNALICQKTKAAPGRESLTHIRRKSARGRGLAEGKPDEGAVELEVLHRVVPPVKPNGKNPLEDAIQFLVAKREEISKAILTLEGMRGLV